MRTWEDDSPSSTTWRHQYLCKWSRPTDTRHNRRSRRNVIVLTVFCLVRHTQYLLPSTMRPPRSFRVLNFVKDATNHVGRHSLVDLLGVRQAEVGHDRGKLIYRLGETRVVHLLLSYGAAVSSLNDLPQGSQTENRRYLGQFQSLSLN